LQEKGNFSWDKSFSGPNQRKYIENIRQPAKPMKKCLVFHGPLKPTKKIKFFNGPGS